jgi:hypothetical protein
MQKFCAMFDPTCGQSGSVGREVRSDIRTNLSPTGGVVRCVFSIFTLSRHVVGVWLIILIGTACA